MKYLVTALFMLGLSATASEALAAARFCDRSAGMTYGNLLRCGATLAAHSFRVGNGCREVLKRYGQI
jgi:hypothetical protein